MQVNPHKNKQQHQMQMQKISGLSLFGSTDFYQAVVVKKRLALQIEITFCDGLFPELSLLWVLRC